MDRIELLKSKGLIKFLDRFKLSVEQITKDNMSDLSFDVVLAKLEYCNNQTPENATIVRQKMILEVGYTLPIKKDIAVMTKEEFETFLGQVRGLVNNERQIINDSINQCLDVQLAKILKGTKLILPETQAKAEKINQEIENFLARINQIKNS